MLIVLDNLSIHCANEIIDTIQAEGHIVCHLPLYSPDFNPIELTFGVLKAWIKRYYHLMRSQCADFGEFLWRAIIESKCDRFARAQFRHAAGGVYIEQDELQPMRERLRAFERGEIDLEET